MKARMKIARIDKFTPVFNFVLLFLWSLLFFLIFPLLYTNTHTHTHLHYAYNRLTHLDDVLTEIMYNHLNWIYAYIHIKDHVRNFLHIFVTQLMYGAFRKYSEYTRPMLIIESNLCQSLVRSLATAQFKIYQNGSFQFGNFKHSYSTIGFDSLICCKKKNLPFSGQCQTFCES